MSHVMHGTGIPTWMVDVYGKLVGKYTSPRILWVYYVSLIFPVFLILRVALFQKKIRSEFSIPICRVLV